MSLFGSAISGIKWATGAQACRQGLQFVTIIVIARILNPEDFGLVAMATVVTGFLQIFSDLGSSAALVQKKDVSAELLSSLFWVNVFFGGGLAIVVSGVAPLVGYFYDDLRVVALLRVLAVSFLVSGCYVTPQAILQKELRFKTLAQVEILATVSGAIVGIGAAVNGAGVWSLVYQSLSISIATLVLIWLLSSWRPRIVFNVQELKTVTSYSLNLVWFNVFNYFIRNTDYLLIGKFLGAQSLGYYTLAYRIMLFPLQNISGVIGRVMFPVYSQMQDDDVRFRKAYLKVVASVAFVTIPMMAGLLVLSQSFVMGAFGENWHPVALLLMILAPVGLVQSIGSTVGGIYQAKGRTDLMLKWGLVAGCLAVGSFVVGLRWGVVGVATAYALLSLVVLSYPSFSIPFGLIGLKVSSLIREIAPTMKSTSIMFFGLVALNFLAKDHLQQSVFLGVAVVLGVTIYLATSWILNKAQCREILTLLQGRT